MNKIKIKIKFFLFANKTLKIRPMIQSNPYANNNLVGNTHAIISDQILADDGRGGLPLKVEQGTPEVPVRMIFDSSVRD